jgi:signal transduction histidine kinase
MDAKQMYSAFYNLINNAIPETPSEGSITVKGTVERLDGQEFACLKVIDTGRGMPEHVRARLFTDDAVSTKVGGTGLGTRIVKNVVEVHGGSVRVESEENRGTTFTLWFPLHRSGIPDPVR